VRFGVNSGWFRVVCESTAEQTALAQNGAALKPLTFHLKSQV